MKFGEVFQTIGKTEKNEYSYIYKLYKVNIYVYQKSC